MDSLLSPVQWASLTERLLLGGHRPVTQSELVYLKHRDFYLVPNLWWWVCCVSGSMVGKRSEQCRLSSQLVFQLVSSENGLSHGHLHLQSCFVSMVCGPKEGSLDFNLPVCSFPNGQQNSEALSAARVSKNKTGFTRPTGWSREGGFEFCLLSRATTSVFHSSQLALTLNSHSSPVDTMGFSFTQPSMNLAWAFGGVSVA